MRTFDNVIARSKRLTHHHLTLEEEEKVCFIQIGERKREIEEAP